MTNRPAPGDFVLYRHPHKRHAGKTSAGRIAQRNSKTVSVHRPCQKVAHVGKPCQCKTSTVRVPLDRLIGWWPKGSKNRSTDNMRQVAP